MKDQGITILRLARMTGLSYFYIHKLARGERKNPSWRVMCLISKALRVKPADLFNPYG